MNRNDIITWLREECSDRLLTLWAQADAIRRAHVGDAVHLRGLLEISNYCRRQCAYCGLRCGNANVQRYRLTREQIITGACQAAENGYGTVVLQSGEDINLTGEMVAEIIVAIKQKTELAITLSLGERSIDDLIVWRQAGADRYLLRFETSDPDLFVAIHPPVAEEYPQRQFLLGELQGMGYEVGSGVMIGIPGQSLGSLADDIIMFSRLNLDMIGVGPYILHPDTPLASQANVPLIADQAPDTVLMTLKVIALTRLMCPDANIPATTALAVLDPQAGYETALQCGANVIMPNVTPVNNRDAYDVYPGKTNVFDAADEFDQRLKQRIRAIGRSVSVGRGDSPHFLASRRSSVQHA
ncbi:MAG: [FeFe] hydrogenase H-cluster radical SAM maturase HydE [Sedimentisphaerales bacterium]|nr:[FeFe] hydrogenase H-cluster radical SAM maturase HydE [Sedimentisphaerales bacterium]